MNAVRYTHELARIVNLPRRDPNDPYWLTFAKELTECLRTPNGAEELRPIQALGLHDLATCGGAFCPIEVGDGKTHLTLLAAEVVEAGRPVLVLPAHLIKKTRRAIARLSAHWRIPRHIELVSYEFLGRTTGADWLERTNPDLLMFDESQKLKNPHAAVTRRVRRFIEAHPEAKVMALSGTCIRDSLLDCAHVIEWCLKDTAPVPSRRNELEEWALALDPGVPDEARFEPGALLQLALPEDGDDPRVAARRAFRRRLFETPGVVATIGEGTPIGASLYINAQTYDVAPVIEQHFVRLRGAWETPDGWYLLNGAEVWRHARELALGFHAVWDPRPPQVWMDARRNWESFVREKLSRSRTIDSPEQVEEAYPEQPELLEWLAFKDTFTPNAVPVWHDDSALRLCMEWMREPGIVWTEHVHFAQRLSAISGVKYYGQKGLARDGEYIEDAKPGPIIASIDANREGKDLQFKWSRNLITSPPQGPDEWQQVLGRTHRSGQTADQVTVDVLLGCKESVTAWRKALEGTRAVRDMVGGRQPKLLIADIDAPTDAEIAQFAGPRWRNSRRMHIT